MHLPDIKSWLQESRVLDDEQLRWQHQSPVCLQRTCRLHVKCHGSACAMRWCHGCLQGFSQRTPPQRTQPSAWETLTHLHQELPQLENDSGHQMRSFTEELELDDARCASHWSRIAAQPQRLHHVICPTPHTQAESSLYGLSEPTNKVLTRLRRLTHDTALHQPKIHTNCPYAPQQCQTPPCRATWQLTVQSCR